MLILSAASRLHPDDDADPTGFGEPPQRAELVRVVAELVRVVVELVRVVVELVRVVVELVRVVVELVRVVVELVQALRTPAAFWPPRVTCDRALTDLPGRISRTQLAFPRPNTD